MPKLLTPVDPKMAIPPPVYGRSDSWRLVPPSTEDDPAKVKAVNEILARLRAKKGER